MIIKNGQVFQEEMCIRDSIYCLHTAADRSGTCVPEEYCSRADYRWNERMTPAPV